LPARLVTTEAGLPADGEAEPGEERAGPADGAGDGGLGLLAGSRPGNGAGAGVAGEDLALPAAPGGSEKVPALPLLHGRTGTLGPPSRPTAITIKQASSATPAPTPSRRIRRRRRPDRSVNTGGPSVAGGFRGGGRCSDPRWVPALRAPDPVTAADPFGHPGHRAGNSRRSAAQ